MSRSPSIYQKVGANLSRILIVDDEKELVMLLEDELKAKGHEVLTAFDGQTGIELCWECGSGWTPVGTQLFPGS